MAKELSNQAPIILTWVPKIHGASLPNGKNSSLNYLETVKDHKLKNKEERDIYLVINGPGFEESQTNDLNRELEGIDGVYVVDLHKHDWSKIDTGWKIDGKDVSIKDFFRDMYNMTDEQRTHFAVEIDTFRLIALALSEKMTGQEGAIYIDFDALRNINGHVGKDITIPEGILLGSFVVGSVLGVDVITKNNDLIVISNPSVAISILDGFKDKLLSQKEIYNKAIEYVQGEKAKVVTSLTNTISNMEEMVATDGIERFRGALAYHEKIHDKKLEILSNGGIEALYSSNIVDEAGLNPTLLHTINMARSNPVTGEEIQWKLVAFGENNGNYVGTLSRDLSWMKGEDLYHRQVDSKLEEAKIDQMKMEKLSLA